MRRRGTRYDNMAAGYDRWFWEAGLLWLFMRCEARNYHLGIYRDAVGLSAAVAVTDVCTSGF